MTSNNSQQRLEKHGEFSIDGHSLRIEERVGGTTTEYRLEIPSQVSPGEFVFTTMIFNSDKGIVVILDSRVVNKRYGTKFLAAIPKCKVEVISAKK